MKRILIFILALIGGLALVAATVCLFLGVIYAFTISPWYLLLEAVTAVCIVLCMIAFRAADRLIDN